MRRMPLIVALDKDQDGKLSLQEVEAAPLSLARLDEDRSGNLTVEELVPRFGGFGGPGPGGRPPKSSSSSGSAAGAMLAVVTLGSAAGESLKVLR